MHIYIYIYNETCLNRNTMRSTLSGPFRKVVGLCLYHTVPKFIPDGQPNMQFCFVFCLIVFTVYFLLFLLYLEAYLRVHRESTSGNSDASITELIYIYIYIYAIASD